MTRVVKVEERQRGVFGKIIKWLFIIFNVLMLTWLGSYWMDLGDMSQNLSNDFERASLGIGGTIGTGLVLSVWLFGDLFLGLFVLLTRGKKVTIEKTID